MNVYINIAKPNVDTIHLYLNDRDKIHMHLIHFIPYNLIINISKLSHIYILLQYVPGHIVLANYYL